MFYTWGVQDRQRSPASLKTELWGAQARRPLFPSKRTFLWHPTQKLHPSRRLIPPSITHPRFRSSCWSGPRPHTHPSSRTPALLQAPIMSHWGDCSSHEDTCPMSHRLPSLPNATREQSLHSHPIAHSLGAIHGMHGMAAKLLGRWHGRLRFPRPPFSDVVHPACISGLQRTLSVYVHLGSSSRFNPCLMLAFPLFDIYHHRDSTVTFSSLYLPLNFLGALHMSTKPH